MQIIVPVEKILAWEMQKGKPGLCSLFSSLQAAPVTGTEDLTYANLKFEKKGPKPTSSDIVYTEIKPLQQQQKSGDAGAADTGMDVSPKGDGK